MVARVEARVAGMGKREKRADLGGVVSRYERAGQHGRCSRQSQGGAAALQYWICKLDEEAEGARRRSGGLV